MSTSKPTTFSPIKYDELCFLAGEPIPNGWAYCELPPGMTAPPIHLTRTDDGIVREYYRERLARVGDIGRADEAPDLPFVDPKQIVYEPPKRIIQTAPGRYRWTAQDYGRVDWGGIAGLSVLVLSIVLTFELICWIVK